MQTTAARLLETIEQAFPLLEQIGESAAAQRPAPGKWSPKEIIGHLIDSANNNQQKFVRMMAASEIHFVGYAQDHWVSAQRYNERPWAELLVLWAAFNRHIAHVMASCPDECLAHNIYIEGAGPFTLGFIMPDYVEHLKHHLRAILPHAGIESAFSNVYGA